MLCLPLSMDLQKEDARRGGNAVLLFTSTLLDVMKRCFSCFYRATILIAARRGRRIKELPSQETRYDRISVCQ